LIENNQNRLAQIDPYQCRLEVAHPALLLELHRVKMVTGGEIFNNHDNSISHA
jgi:hypothetical protein